MARYKVQDPSDGKEYIVDDGESDSPPPASPPTDSPGIFDLGGPLDTTQFTTDVGNAGLGLAKSTLGAITSPISTFNNVKNAISNATPADYVNFTGRGAAMGVGGAALSEFPPLIPAGAAAGGFLYDQIGQLGGTIPDTPIEKDAANFLGRDLLGNYAGYGLMKGVGPAIEGIGGFGENLYDKTKALRSAISQTDSDYERGVPGKTPLAEAIPQIDLFKNPDILKSSQPFTDLYEGVTGEKKAVGQLIGEFLDTAPNSTTVGDIRPSDILDAATKDGVPNGTLLKNQTAGLRTAIANTGSKEYELLAEEALGTDDYNLYKEAQKRVDTFEEKQSNVEFENRTGNKKTKKFDVKDQNRLATAQADVADYEDQINSYEVTARNLDDKRQGYDSNSKIAQGGPENDKATTYAALADSSRKTVSSLVDDPAFDAANKDFGALSTVEGPLNRRMQTEQYTQRPGVIRRAAGTVAGGVRNLFSDSNFYSGDPSTNLSRAFGQSLPQRIGAGISGAGQAIDSVTSPLAPYTSAQGLLNTPKTQVGDVNLPFESTAQAESPALSPDRAPAPLSLNLNPPAPIPKEGFQLPRDISTLDQQGVTNLIPLFVAKNDAQPLISQWNRIRASGDKSQVAQFLGAMSEAYPDFPLQHGAVTGLPSEFDIGDGKTRLYSPTDQLKWEQTIDKSPLREDEKAMRVAALRKDGLVVPLSVKTNNLDDLLSQSSPGDLAMQNFLNTTPLQPREQNIFGSRRLE